MVFSSLLLASLASSASAVKLYVTSYGGNPGAVTTLELTPGLAEGAYVNAAELKSLSVNEECGSAPTWLDQSLGQDKLVCIDEGFSSNASINTLAIAADGSLKSTARTETIAGPVSTQFYNNNTAVALAHYGGGAITVYKVSPESTYTLLQNFTFDTPPGPRPEQEKSHVHHAAIDPTGKFIVFPDLGADVTRVYSVDPSTSELKEQEPLKANPASGPRHAVFWSSGNTTFLFVIHELNNKIVSYSVSYPTAGGLSFKQVQEIGLYGDREDPVGTRAAEISLSPDNKFVIASNRNATVFNVTNQDPTNSTQVASDSLVTFKPAADGKLTFVQLAPSGGKFPRHFKLNGDGSLIAVGNQNSKTVDIWARNVETGELGNRIASAINFPGEVTNIVWDER